MLSVCKTPQMFKGEIMRRTKETGQYFVERLYEDLSDAPTKEEIEYVYKNGFILSSEAPESAKLSLVVGLTTNIDTNKSISESPDIDLWRHMLLFQWQ